MPKLSDRTPGKRFIGLFVGRSGSGKTVAEASFPGDKHFMDFDGRIGGLEGVDWIDRDKITYDYYPPRDRELISKVNKKLDAWLVASSVGQHVPETLITDSITSETYAFLCQAIPLTHHNGQGRSIGPLAMPGPADYGFEAQNTYDYMSFLRSLPINNIIVSAHYVDRYGKADPSNPYSENIVIGKKLSVRDKIGENIQIYFDHIFELEREVINDREKFFVTFRGDLARTSYSWLPEGRHEITGKNFYEFMNSFRKEGENEDKSRS